MSSLQRKGKGRPLVLLHEGVGPEVVDALAGSFEVLAWAADGLTEPSLRSTLSALRIERPLLVGVGPRAVALACELARHRMPRGVVLTAAPAQPLTAPVLQVEALDAAALAAFDAPLA
ncbi:MAG: hypothetical protein IPJ65_42130 [Archangiaceae bacterium]|nr:hypothetical protein [Archangiaceae bacterium]